MGDARDAVETIGRWVTVRQASERVGRSIDWVRRQYRSGAVESRTRDGRYGPERLVDIHALQAVAEAPKVGTMAAPSSGPSLPVLAETLHELARQLGEAQERAARAEAEAEEARLQLAEAEQDTGEQAGAEDGEAPAESPDTTDDASDDPDRHAQLWLAANEQYLRALPGGAAREAAGVRLAGGRTIDIGKRPRWWRPG
jgi:hypothetical protein